MFMLKEFATHSKTMRASFPLISFFTLTKYQYNMDWSEFES